MKHLKKKLTVNKVTISNLEKNEMENIRAGFEKTEYSCRADLKAFCFMMGTYRTRCATDCPCPY
ncbi:MAG: class I lanthipeptide [Candidatus Omnitrophota bacterium]